ncbi:hypothetical protein D5R81_15135 [Parashewanella spongiae]|uniref:Lipoprotein n=1 Tax=Parashewanella spongiae TaxID=342950 RepID=A0A3A6TFK1_9GAMM|nr:hypothetical protein [Parashewanella spongiae]MCL1079060.1 hypothetical protein [Parashewanella spongiae]RJY07862.1 hypothetical protein D5R81_15135 [Parashewanella spongiae]
MRLILVNFVLILSINLTGCLSTPTIDNGTNIEVPIPQSLNDSALYLSDAEIQKYGNDWYVLYNNWIYPNTDPHRKSSLRFPDGKISALKGQQALINGYERFCRTYGGEIINSNSQTHTIMNCKSTNKATTGRLKVSRIFKNPPNRVFSPGAEYWSLGVRYFSNQHNVQNGRTDDSFESRKTQKVTGVIELENGEKYNFLNFGTLEDNLVLELEFGGAFNSIHYPIQDVAYLDFYPEASGSNIGVLLIDGRYRMLNSVSVRHRESLNVSSTFGINGLNIVVNKNGQHEVMNFRNLNGIKRIYIGDDSIKNSVKLLEMQRKHKKILDPLIKKRQIAIAKGKKRREENMKREIEEKKRLVLAKQLLQKKLASVDVKRKRVAEQFGKGSQVCHAGTVKYRVCSNANFSNSCRDNQTTGSVYGYIVNKFENGFIEMRVSGLANIPDQDRELYNRFGVGKMYLDSLSTEPGVIIRVDSLKVESCFITDNPILKLMNQANFQ